MLLRIFEFGAGLERGTGGAGQYQLPLDELELRHRDGDIVFRTLEVAAGVDDSATPPKNFFTSVSLWGLDSNQCGDGG